MLRSIILKRIAILFILIFYSCKSPNNPPPVTDNFFDQIPPRETPVRFAKEIITNNFYPHSNYFPSTYTHFYWVDAKIIGTFKPE